MGVIGIATAIKNRRGKEEEEEEIPQPESDAAAAEILRQTEDALAQLEIDPTPAEEAPQAASGENGEPSTLDFSDSIPAYEAAPEGARFDPSLIGGGEVAPPPDVLAASSPRLGVQPDAGVDWMGTVAAAEPPPVQGRPVPVAAPPPIVLDGFREVTGQPQVPISGADLPATQAPPPQPPAAAQGPSVPRSYLEYQQARDRAQRQDRARMAIQQILRLVGGATALGMAGADNPRGAAIANAATRLAAGAVPDADRVQRAQQEYGIARQVEADQRQMGREDAADDLGWARLAQDAEQFAAREGRLAAGQESLAELRRINADVAQRRQVIRDAEESDRQAYEIDSGSERANAARSQLRRILDFPVFSEDPQLAQWAANTLSEAEGWSAARVDKEIDHVSRAMNGDNIRSLLRRRGRGGGASPVAPGATGPSWQATDLARWESEGPGLPEGVSIEARAAQYDQLGVDEVTKRHRAAIANRRTTANQNEDQIATQVRQLAGEFGSSAEYNIAVNSAMRHIQDLSDGQLRLLLAGGSVPAGFRPEAWAAADGAIQTLRLMRGKQLSGAAVSEAERAMIDRSMSLMTSSDPAVVRGAIRAMQNTIRTINARIRAGYSDDVIRIYDANARREFNRIRSRGRGARSTVTGETRRDPETNERISSPAQRGRGPSRGDMVTIRVTTASGQTAERTVSRDRVQQYRRAAEANGGTVEEVR